MGRELIYPGEKQIKALLSTVLRHTIAYINILSWAIQVSKGLVHLHLHKGPPHCSLRSPISCPPDECLLSSPSPPRLPPSSPSLHLSPRCFSLSRSISPLCALLQLNSRCLLSSEISLHILQLLNMKVQIFFLETNLHGSDDLIYSDTDISLVDRRCRVHREKQESADTVENVMVIYGAMCKSSLRLHCIKHMTHFSYSAY